MKKYLREYSELHDCSWFEWPCRLTKRLIPEAALVQRGNVDGRLLPRARSREEWISCVEGTESTPLQTRRLCTLECRVGFPLLSIYIWLSHSHSASNHPCRTHPPIVHVIYPSRYHVKQRDIHADCSNSWNFESPNISLNPWIISFYPFTTMCRKKRLRFSFWSNKIKWTLASVRISLI